MLQDLNCLLSFFLLFGLLRVEKNELTKAKDYISSEDLFAFEVFLELFMKNFVERLRCKQIKRFFILCVGCAK